MARPKPTGRHERQAMANRLPIWLIDWLREQPESAAVLIERALIKAHKLTPPPKSDRADQ